MKKLIAFSVKDCLGDFSHFNSFDTIFKFFSQTDITGNMTGHTLATIKTIENIFFPLIQKSIRPDLVQLLQSYKKSQDMDIILYANDESPWVIGLVSKYLSKKDINIKNAYVFQDHTDKNIAYPSFWPITKTKSHIKNFNFIREKHPERRIIAFDIQEYDFGKTLQKRLGDIFIKVDKAPVSRILHKDCLDAWITFQSHVGASGMRTDDQFFDIRKSDIMLLTLEQLKQVEE